MTYVDQIQEAVRTRPTLPQDEVYAQLQQWQTRCDTVEGTRQERIQQTPLREKERQALLQLYAQHIKMIKERLVDTDIEQSWQLFQLVMLGYDADQALLTTYLYSAVRREDLPDRRRQKPDDVAYDDSVHSPQQQTQEQNRTQDRTQGKDLLDKAIETALRHAERQLQAAQLKQALENALQ